MWSSTTGNINILSGLSPGTYNLELYSDATVTCSGGTVYASNNGSNYIATFTVSADFISLNTIGATSLEDFNALVNSGTGVALPTGWRILETGTAANNTYTAGTGSTATGDSYSFGATGSSERALGGVQSGSLKAENINPAVFQTYLTTASFPDPELMIRTSGEYRISNFLLYQLAYTELYFTPVTWPDFKKEHFLQAIEDYQKRERRFGKTGQQIKTEKQTT